ncbi:MAG TPA: plasmid pRiA4b ORF-3 family protein [Acidimicrobiales bacterium]|nr:plasmid pRiA4b ORF-3 family protein [Acidimicrobiales bacterium]
MSGPRAGSRLTVHLLRITLLDVSPPVWRLVRVPSAVTLAVLHAIVQVSMGWEDRHLHEWRVGDAVYSGDEEDWGEGAGDESAVLLGDLAPADSVLRYDYDFGDGWEHLVEVVSVEPYDGTVPPVSVIDGARAAPPEDCGGPAGYEHLLDALADPDDPEHEELTELIGDRVDPDYFDRAAVNRRLESFWKPPA